jgi:uncharacterized protein (TIGR03437 family)
VARSYVRQLAAGSMTDAPTPATSQPDDYTPRDRIGHGTAAASAAAGWPSTGTVTVTGVAPKAYLGNYKIYGSSGVNDYTTEDIVIQALEDAVDDGMDVVNFSSGFVAITGALDSGAACGLPTGTACDMVAAAFENAAKAGVVIVSSAGNDGTNYQAAAIDPIWGSVRSPAHAPSVLAVGATLNGHVFTPTVSVPGGGSELQNIKAVPSDSSNTYPSQGAYTGPLVDVSQIGDGYACSPFPDGWLRGATALVQRGPTGPNACTFDVKATNVQNAGATAMIIYQAPDSPPFYNNDTALPGVYNFYGPAVGISNAAGVALKNYAAAHPGASATIDLAGFEQQTDNANQVTAYSSLGPSVGVFTGSVCAGCSTALLKPDLVAPGGGDPLLPAGSGMPGLLGMYMAGEKVDESGELYSANGYVAADGTSFAAPMVAGAAALVKQAHPDWKPEEIRSALVNGSNSQIATKNDRDETVDTRAAGSGLLDAGAATAATVVASPTSVSFGSIRVGDALPGLKTVTLTNRGSSAVTLAISVAAQNASSSASVQVDKSSIALQPGASGTLGISLTGSTPADAGAFSGNINLTGSGIALHVPYQFVAGKDEKTLAAVQAGNAIPIFGSSFEALPGHSLGVAAIQLIDKNGAPLTGVPVTLKSNGSNVIMGSPVGWGQACAPATSTQAVTCNTDAYGIAYTHLTAGTDAGDTYIDVYVGGTMLYYPQLYAYVRTQPTASGVSDSAKGRPSIAPGSYISIYGSSLSDYTWSELSAKLPLSLAGVTVSFDVPSRNISEPGRIIYVSPTQVNVQAPWALQTVPAGTNVQMKVTVDETLYGNVISVPVAQVSPSFFEIGGGAVAARKAGTATIVTASTPAEKGSWVELYANGLGPVSNQPADGEAAKPSPNVSETADHPTVTIGGQPANVNYCGLAPGFAGLYQVNVQIPAAAQSGTQPLVMTIGGQTATTNIPVQ